MRTRFRARSMLLGLLLSAAAAVAAANEPRALGATAARTPQGTPRTSREVIPFKTERTDSWLCQNVSAFFCASRPGMISQPSPATTANSKNRRRGRS